MSLLRRLTTTLSAKANALLDRYDEPGEALNLAFQLLVEQVERVGRASEHLASAEQVLAAQLTRLEQCIAAVEAQAIKAVKQ